MRIVCISDTHDFHDEVVLPDGDMIIHAGDCTGWGRLDQFEPFVDWFSSLDYKYKIFISGNHDWCLYRKLDQCKMIMKNIIYLQDDEITIEGLKIYGTPWQPEFCAWAWNLPRLSRELDEKLDKIPVDTNILITHAPPAGILDKILEGERTGCELLLDKLNKLQSLKLHVFGHIHEDYGIKKKKDITFVNASICTREYYPTNKPIVVEV